MAGIAYPGVSGAAALGANAGLVQGLETGLKLRQADELSLLRGLQTQREALGLQQQQAEEEGAQIVLGAPSTTPLYEPAVEGSIAANIPGVTPGVEPWSPPGQPQIGGEAGNYVAAPGNEVMPSIAVTAPKPAVAGAPYVSMEETRKKMTPRQQSSFFMSPRAQSILKLKNVMTEAEVDKQRRNHEGYKQLREAMEKAQTAFDNGDIEKGLQAQRSAFLAKSALDDDPQKWMDRYLAKQEELKAWAKDQDNPKIQQATQEWVSKTSKLQKKYSDDPTDANMTSYMMAVQDYPIDSHLARQMAPIMLRKIAEESRVLSHPVLDALRQEASDKASQNMNIGKDLDQTMVIENNADAILNKDPARRSAVQSVLLNQIEAGKKPPEWLLRITGLGHISKTVADMAAQNLRDRGLDPTLPKNGAVYAAEFAKITKDLAKVPASATDISQTQHALITAQQHANSLRIELNNLRKPNSGATPEDIEKAKADYEQANKHVADWQKQQATLIKGAPTPPEPTGELAPKPGPVPNPRSSSTGERLFRNEVRRLITDKGLSVDQVKALLSVPGGWESAVKRPGIDVNVDAIYKEFGGTTAVPGAQPGGQPAQPGPSGGPAAMSREEAVRQTLKYYFGDKPMADLPPSEQARALRMVNNLINSRSAQIR